MSTNTPKLSIQIILPEEIDRRFARWARETPGSSWPTGEGHITLVPAFHLPASIDEVRTHLEAVCAREKPFEVRLGPPLAMQDMTRPDYFIVFVMIEPVTDSPEMTLEGVDSSIEAPIYRLRRLLLEALENRRLDLFPQLVEQPFRPHITLALGVGESETGVIIRSIRAQPIEAQFEVDVVWLIVNTGEDGTRVERYPLPLGRAVPRDLLRF